MITDLHVTKDTVITISRDKKINVFSLSFF